MFLRGIHMPNKQRETIEIKVPSKAVRISHATCPEGHSLMNTEHKINGYPSIGVRVRYKDQTGLIYLDPVYGSFKNVYEIKVPENEVVEFFCPTCETSLTYYNHVCQNCKAPMFDIKLPHEGIVAGCLRNGCHFHMLKLADGEKLLKALDEEGTLDSFV
jgi:hypothetical protein